MTVDRRGFAPVMMMLLIVAGIAVLGGAFYYFHLKGLSTLPIENNPPVIATSTPTPVSSSTTSITTSAWLSPSRGPVGTAVTIHGSGFAAAGNTVTFNGLVGPSLKNISSPDGKTLTFIIPGSLGPDCKINQPCPQFLMMVTAGTFSVSVTSNGVAQSAGAFTVTGGGLRPIPQS